MTDEYTIAAPGELMCVGSRTTLLMLWNHFGVTESLKAVRSGVEKTIVGQMREDDERRFFTEL